MSKFDLSKGSDRDPEKWVQLTVGHYAETISPNGLRGGLRVYNHSLEAEGVIAEVCSHSRNHGCLEYIVFYPKYGGEKGTYIGYDGGECLGHRRAWLEREELKRLKIWRFETLPLISTALRILREHDFGFPIPFLVEILDKSDVLDVERCPKCDGPMSVAPDNADVSYMFICKNEGCPK